jgi:hypothetical protein
VFIPPADRTAEDTKPFAIRHERTDTKPAHIVRFLTETEIERPDQILAWVFEGDLSKHGLVSILERQKLAETAAQLVDLKRQQEAAAERQELAAAQRGVARDDPQIPRCYAQRRQPSEDF